MEPLGDSTCPASGLPHPAMPHFGSSPYRFFTCSALSGCSSMTLPPSSRPNWHRFLLALLLCSPLLFHWAGCQSCGPKVSPRLLREIPCDMSTLWYCTQPGSAYPWSAVRRYIYENQGFMKRMYGESRQSQIIREEMYRMNEQYSTLDVAAFRTAKSDPSTTADNETKEMAQQKGIDLNQSDVTFNVSTSESKLDLEVAVTGESEVESEAELYSTTLGDNLASSMVSSTLEATEDRDAPTTSTTTDLDNLVPEEKPNKASKGYNACPITQEVVAPYWANNTRGETLALLNVYPFEQYIHWEKCAFEGEQMLCREGCRCEQQYRLHRLLAFDPKNECRGIFADWFRFPGCCVCICYDNHERINNRKARL